MPPTYHFVQITDPDGKLITVARNTRDDPIGQLFVTGQIDRHQRAAADAYQADIESLAGHHRAPSRGPDDVTGWRARRSDDGRNRKPRDRIRRAEAALGPDQTAVVQGALAGRLVDTRKLCQALDKLAVVYGFATRTIH